MSEIRIDTKLGTLSARPYPCRDYPAIAIYAQRGQQEMLVAWVESDQTVDPPALKLHVYADCQADDPTYSGTISQAELDAYYADSRPEPPDRAAAIFTSVWDGGAEYASPCSIDLATGEIVDIEPCSLSDSVMESLEHLEREYVTWDGMDYPVHERDDGSRYIEHKSGGETIGKGNEQERSDRNQTAGNA